MMWSLRRMRKKSDVRGLVFKIRCLSYVCSPFYIPQYIWLNGAYFILNTVAWGLRLNICPFRAQFILPRTSAFLVLGMSGYQTMPLIFGLNPFHHSYLSENLAMIGFCTHILLSLFQSPSVRMGSCSMFRKDSMAEICGLRFPLLAAH
jgi:hypothetical protein